MSRYHQDGALGETEKSLRSFVAGLWTTVGFAGIALALAVFGIVRGLRRKAEVTEPGPADAQPSGKARATMAGTVPLSGGKV